MGSIPILDNYYNNAPVPGMFTENSKEKCLFDKNIFNVTQDNDVGYDNHNNRGRYTLQNNFNGKKLLHDNINDNVTNEFIDERDIIVDTIDRDITIFKNIFNFTLKLGSTNTTVQPSVHRSLNNVKYLKLLRVIFPDNYFLTLTTHTELNLQSCITNFIQNNHGALNSGSTLFDATHSNSSETIYIIHYHADTDNSKFYIDYFRDVSSAPDYSIVYQAIVNASTLSSSSAVATHNRYTAPQDTQIEKGRYYQLHIEQLPQNNDLATGDSVSKSFSLLFPSKEDSRGFNILNALETDKIFKFSNLGNFSSFGIKIKDARGNDLDGDISEYWNTELDNYNNKDRVLNTNSSTLANFKYSFRGPDKYFRHPFCWRSQALFIFTVGEVSIELNKRTFS